MVARLVDICNPSRLLLSKSAPKVCATCEKVLSLRYVRTAKMKYSVLIPVFNRPDEVSELLDSLTRQTLTDFEVVVVEDGSTVPCQEVCENYSDRLPVRYFTKDNSGPGRTRNFAAERAAGEWLIILDSDCVLPTTYLEEVERELLREDTDAFGGPDRAHPDFNNLQKAVSYAMTSFFTTGGIRGGKKKLDKFYPRSFNMGVRRDVYTALHGFSEMRFGEDIDFSTRIFKAGYRCRLFPEAWVWHKRRTDLWKFFKQVHNSGIARINLMKRHPGTLKLVHTLPALAVALGTLLILSAFICPWALTLPALWCLLIFIDATLRNRSLHVGAIAVAASAVQIVGYGTGFLRAAWERLVLGHDEFHAFKKNFYK